MRPAALLNLLIPAACGASLGLVLVGCHKDSPAATQASAAAALRTLKVERYDAPIPKAPLQGGKLETLNEPPLAVAQPAASPPVEATPAAATPPPAAAVAPAAPAEKPVARAFPAQRPPAGVVAARPAQPRAYAAQAYEDRVPADAYRYGYGDRQPPRPGAMWAGDPRRAQGPADPSPRYEAYSRAPDPREDEDETALPGFRITLPICRQAQRQGDPLAETGACQDMLQTDREQLRLCRRAFEDGDDRIALSPACRQSARGR